MLILSVETSAVSASCALLEDDKIIGEYFINNRLTHSKTLVPMIENMLKIAEISIEQVDLFAVSIGPGSFTGLRIGIATIKGIVAPLDKPCIGVSTLEALAQNVVMHNGLICCVMDARCEQIYNALFMSDGNNIERICDDRAISIKELSNELEKFSKKKIILVGDGANLCYNHIRTNNNVSLATPLLLFQKASSVALLAKKLFNEDKSITSNELKPLYLRLPQAVRELKNKGV